MLEEFSKAIPEAIEIIIQESEQEDVLVDKSEDIEVA